MLFVGAFMSSSGGGAAAATYPVTLGIVMLIGGIVIIIIKGSRNKTKKLKITANGTCTYCDEARKSGFKICPYCDNEL